MNINTKVNGKLAASVIAIAGVVAPIIILSSLEVEGFQLSPSAILLPERLDTHDSLTNQCVGLG